MNGDGGARAVFLDKDGTLIENLPYNVVPARIVLARGAGAALRLLQSLGYRLIVVSNQPGVARGYFSEAALQPVWNRIRKLLAAEGVRDLAFYHCPHHPAGVRTRLAIECTCRKPQPGMLLRAAREHGIALGSSWMIGDILDDVEAGKRAGCRSILIDNGNETEWVGGEWRTPDLIVPHLPAAALALARCEHRTPAGDGARRHA